MFIIFFVFTKSERLNKDVSKRGCAMTTVYPNPSCCKFVTSVNTLHRPSTLWRMAPDTSLQPFVGASSSSMAPETIPTSPRTLRDSTLEEELVDPDAKLILSDFTHSIPSCGNSRRLIPSNGVLPHGLVQKHVLYKYPRS
jgi:hypothetical protein